MRILLCHNYYRYRGGEDQSFESEVAMLRQRGHKVVTYVRSNNDIKDGLNGRIHAVGRTFYSRSAKQDVAKLMDDHQIDILHCNNLFPQISHSVYSAAAKRGIPIVQALRNYRPFCANSFFYRDDQVCTQCLGKPAAFASVRHGCYRDSSAASAVVTSMQLVNRTLNRVKPLVDAYFTPSEFAREIYTRGGYDPESLFVKRNFIDPDPGIGMGGSGSMIYVGRLSKEKGIDTLCDAWRQHGLKAPLKIIGGGPLQQAVKQFAQQHSAVTYLGELPHDEVLEHLGDARCLIMPSQWFETFGRTIAESFSRGTPVIASRLGAMSELVQDGVNGVLFEPGDSEQLAHAIQRVCNASEKRYSDMRNAARTSYKSKYTIDHNYQRLIEIYEFAMQRRGVDDSNDVLQSHRADGAA